MKEGERLEVKGDRLPDDWKWMKLKYLVTENLQYGANESGIEYSSLLPRYIRITDIDSNGKLKNEEMLSLSEEKSENYLLEEGDILFARSGASVGKTFIYKSKYGRASFAGYLIRAKLDKKIINPQFFFYYTLSSEYDIWKNGIFIQSTIQNIGADKYSDLLVPVPPLTSQLSLITFLEKKCSEIDFVISKTRETIEEYKKLKQSIITEVVTGKVKIENGKVCGKYDTYKDSGVEWIGEIPSEWEVKPIKALFSFGKGLPITKDNLTETGLSVISYGQIHSKNNIGTEIRNELIRYVDKIYYETNLQSLVHKGDFIFADTSEDLTGCGNFVYVNREEDLFAGYHTIILFSKEKNDNKYLAYLFQTDCWRRQIRCCCSGVKLFSISRRILGSTNLILPSILEQQQISDFLDQKCSEIDNLITKKEQLVVELEAYKKSLIYEVVTGKRGV